MLINGNLCEDRREVAEHIVNFYSALFTDSRKEASSLQFINELIQPSITQDMNEDLTRIPREEEIRLAVFDLSPTSVPGPDGFGGAFFQAAWDIVKNDVVNAVGFFYRT